MKQKLCDRSGCQKRDKNKICHKLSLLYLQSTDTRASSFVLDANAASSLGGVVEPFESSPDLTGVVFAGGEDGVAGVVEGAREKLVVVAGKRLVAQSIVGLVGQAPKLSSFI